MKSLGSLVFLAAAAGLSAASGPHVAAPAFAGPRVTMSVTNDWDCGLTDDVVYGIPKKLGGGNISGEVWVTFPPPTTPAPNKGPDAWQVKVTASRSDTGVTWHYDSGIQAVHPLQDAAWSEFDIPVPFWGGYSVYAEVTFYMWSPTLNRYVELGTLAAADTSAYLTPLP